MVCVCVNSVSFCTIIAILRQAEVRIRDLVLLLLQMTSRLLYIPGMTGPPDLFIARGPVTLTAILFLQTDV